MNHSVTFEQLVDWLEGRLSAEDAQTIAQQVAADARLQAEVAWLQMFAAAAEEIVFEAPPPEVSARLRRQFAALSAENRPPTWRETLAAVLTFDSRRPPALAGARGAPQSDWQQLYTTDYGDITLVWQRHNDDRGFNLFGQILPHAGATAEPFHVQLRAVADSDHPAAAGAAAALQADTLADGEFVLEGVAPATYELTLTSAVYHIAVPLQLTS